MLERIETRFGIKLVSPHRRQRLRFSGQPGMAGQKERHCPRTSRCSTSPTELTARSPAPTSPSTPNATVTLALRAKRVSVQFRRTCCHSRRSGVTAEGMAKPLFAPANSIGDTCRLKAQCCPTALARKIPRDLHEDARDVARAHASTPEYAQAYRRCCANRDAVSAHLCRILRLTRLRFKGPNGANQTNFSSRPPPKTRDDSFDQGR